MKKLYCRLKKKNNLELSFYGDKDQMWSKLTLYGTIDKEYKATGYKKMERQFILHFKWLDEYFKDH